MTSTHPAVALADELRRLRAAIDGDRNDGADYHHESCATSVHLDSCDCDGPQRHEETLDTLRAVVDLELPLDQRWRVLSILQGLYPDPTTAVVGRVDVGGAESELVVTGQLDVEVGGSWAPVHRFDDSNGAMA